MLEIKVLEPVKNCIKEFDTPDDFNIYYMKNKDEIDKLTTHKLNKMFKIAGYRKTRIKGSLMLRTDYASKKKNDKQASSVDELRDRIDVLQREYDEIKDRMNQLIEIINKQLS
ncbi:hypothetical protein M9Y10_045867 [Tritrichomonas musculus]|uniref:SAM domain-containing protein n=1 Tax=Tritrichomonas musculus TaxID=1915356 RepID=A0ABR2JWS6_9EUKA